MQNRQAEETAQKMKLSPTLADMQDLATRRKDVATRRKAADRTFHVIVSHY